MTHHVFSPTLKSKKLIWLDMHVLYGNYKEQSVDDWQNTHQSLGQITYMQLNTYWLEWHQTISHIKVETIL